MVMIKSSRTQQIYTLMNEFHIILGLMINIYHMPNNYDIL
jgi:hypothetical protein